MQFNLIEVLFLELIIVVSCTLLKGFASAQIYEFSSENVTFLKMEAIFLYSWFECGYLFLRIRIEVEASLIIYSSAQIHKLQNYCIRYRIM